MHVSELVPQVTLLQHLVIGESEMVSTRERFEHRQV